MLTHPAKRINEASRQIVNGEYEEAIEALVNTLKTCKLVLSGDAKIAVPNETNDAVQEEELKQDESREEVAHFDQVDNDGFSCPPLCLEYDFFASPSSSSFLETAVAIEEHAECSAACCNARKLSIFRQPILVTCDDYFEAPLDIRTCEELSYVAIYNLALAHHLMSLQLSGQTSRKQKQEVSSSSWISKQEIYLQKALSLYEHSRQMQTKRKIKVGRSFVHSMAFAANVGQIHYALGNHQEAKTYAQCLLSTMMWVVGYDQVDALGDSADGFLDMLKPLFSENGDDSAPAA